MKNNELKEKVKEYLTAQNALCDAESSLIFYVCFNLLDDDCKYTSGEIRDMIHEIMDASLL